MPERTFTLPAIEDGEGAYYPDVQERFPEVDWDNLERLYIPAGHYRFLRIGNLPVRDPSAPLVITNLGGQVRVGGLDHHYLFGIGGGAGWVLTGRYDPISQTGDQGFPGHRGGAYAGSQSTYGILVDDDFVRDGISGIGIGGGATRFEVEYLEVREVDFAGMLIKTDNDASAVMEGVHLHDLYIHDTGSEGFYIGSTQAQPQHAIRGLELDHCRVLRAGTESLQIGQVTGGVNVHHNVFGPSAIDWRAAFQRYQDGNFQVGARSGRFEIHHNVLLGGAGAMFSMFGALVEGDDTADTDEVYVHDNYLAHVRSLGAYMNSREHTSLTFRLEGNAIRGDHYDYDEVYSSDTEPNHLWRVGTGDTRVEVRDNRFDSDRQLISSLPDEGNGESGMVTGSGNARGAVAPLAFRDAGLPADFDYLRLEMWTDVASLGGDAPVAYDEGDLVMHRAVPYRCRVATCAAGLVPPEHAEAWEELPPFPDDVRTMPGSEYAGIGID